MPPPFSLCLPAWTTLQSVRQSPESDLAFAARSLCCHSSVLMLHLKTSTGIATRVSHVSPQLRNLQKLRTGQSCPYCTHQSRCLITDFDWQWQGLKGRAMSPCLACSCLGPHNVRYLPKLLLPLTRRTY